MVGLKWCNPSLWCCWDEPLLGALLINPDGSQCSPRRPNGPKIFSATFSGCISIPTTFKSIFKGPAFSGCFLPYLGVLKYNSLKPAVPRSPVLWFWSHMTTSTSLSSPLSLLSQSMALLQLSPADRGWCLSHCLKGFRQDQVTHAVEMSPPPHKGSLPWPIL